VSSTPSIIAAAKTNPASTTPRERAKSIAKSVKGQGAALQNAGRCGFGKVAVFRIRIGREIDSAALIADGYHARTDGLTGLAVVAGAVGVWLGFPLADPIIGLLITLAIFGIVWQSAKAVLTRMLDGIEPRIIDEIRHAIEHVPGLRLCEARARWLGHRLHADLVVSLDPAQSVADATRLIETLRSELREHLPALDEARIKLAA
jgi:cation diffusion facilitator family transporter